MSWLVLSRGDFFEGCGRLFLFFPRVLFRGAFAFSDEDCFCDFSWHD
jgi:hypothetical protein